MGRKRGCVCRLQLLGVAFRPLVGCLHEPPAPGCGGLTNQRTSTPESQTRSLLAFPGMFRNVKEHQYGVQSCRWSVCTPRRKCYRVFDPRFRSVAKKFAHKPYDLALAVALCDFMGVDLRGVRENHRDQNATKIRGILKAMVACGALHIHVYIFLQVQRWKTNWKLVARKRGGSSVDACWGLVRHARAPERWTPRRCASCCGAASSSTAAGTSSTSAARA